jgi:hypothetical protein
MEDAQEFDLAHFFEDGFKEKNFKNLHMVFA